MLRDPVTADWTVRAVNASASMSPAFPNDRPTGAEQRNRVCPRSPQPLPSGRRLSHEWLAVSGEAGVPDVSGRRAPLVRPIAMPDVGNPSFHHRGACLR